MPRHAIIYPKEMRHSQDGEYLYGVYRRICRQDQHPEFENFISFYEWATANGYQYGMRLHRLDGTKAYSPDNCVWLPPVRPDRPFYSEEDRKRIADWNRTVNRIRRHFKMKPFPVEDFA